MKKFMSLCLIFCLSLPLLSAPLPRPSKKSLVKTPVFVDVALVNTRIKEKSVYADIINHSITPHMSHTRMTNAHETTHMINSELRMKYRDGKNGFYVLNGKAVLLTEPKCKKNDVREFVPKCLRSYRYNLYIAGQQEWNDTPTYILDEAIAYRNGAMTCIEDVQNNAYKDANTDAISGLVDFSIYSIALAMAVEKHDPNYWQNSQFRPFLVWYLKSAEDNYKIGSTMEEFNWFLEQKTLLNNLRTHPDAAQMRQFIKDNLENLWLGE